MTDDDKNAFAMLIGALCVAFGKEASKPTAAAYWMGLRDLEITAVERAVEAAIQTRKFMPAPGDLRELAGVEPPGLRIAKAWDVARGAIGKYGSYATVQFDDPAITASIRLLGGWREFCNTPPDEMKWRQKEFERIYSGFRQSGVLEEEARPLLGIWASSGGDVLPEGLKVREIVTRLEPTPVRKSLMSAKKPKEIA